MQKFDQKILDGISRELDSLDVDSYLLRNHKKLYVLCNECDDVLVFSEDTLGPKRYVPVTASIYLTKEYFKSINRKYSRKLVKDILCRKIQTGNELSAKFFLYQNRNFRVITSNDLTLMDSYILVHEYTHRLAIKNLKKYRKNPLHKVSSEIIATLNEMDYLDFLRENGFSEYDLELIKDYHRSHFREEIAAFLFTEPLFDSYSTYGKLTPEIMNQLLDYPYYENIEDVNYELEFIGKNLGKIKEYLDYVHPVATMIASHFHQQGIERKELGQMIDQISLNRSEYVFPKVSQEQLVDAVQKEFVLKKK